MGRYSSVDVADLLGSYPGMVRRVRAGRGGDVEEELRWLEVALARLPERMYEVLRLRVREGLTNRQSAARLGVHPNTASRRYLAGVAWLAGFLTAPELGPALRRLDWREAVRDLPPPPRSRLPEKARAGRGRAGGGRPRRIPVAIDVEVVRCYCAGLTQQEIADRLNARTVPAVGREWRRSSIRTILRRYNVRTRPRGRRLERASSPGVSPGRVDYRHAVFGEPLCDADELLRRGGVDPAALT
jgi:DNA-binding CsgD family transcriptional regulator